MTEVFGMPITYLIFAGDMLVMAFMIAVVVWVSIRANDEQISSAARIPLEDDDAVAPPRHGSGRTGGGGYAE